MIERAVYRWDDWNAPIAHAVFDPFDSPWKPATPSHARPQPEESAGGPGPAVADLDSVDDLRAAVDEHEKRILEHALCRNRWNQRQTAKALGLSYDQLRHAIKKHGLADDG